MYVHLHVRFVHVAFGCRIYVCPVVCPQRSIRCADAVIEWGLLSQVPKPAKLLNAGEFRSLRRATRALPSTCKPLKRLERNFYIDIAGCEIMNSLMSALHTAPALQ